MVHTEVLGPSLGCIEGLCEDNRIPYDVTQISIVWYRIYPWTSVEVNRYLGNGSANSGRLYLGHGSSLGSFARLAILVELLNSCS